MAADRKPPALSARKNIAVNRVGKESIWWPLYDIQAYAALGQTELNFYQLPVGQNNKTLADTNMTSAGQLPANQSFIVTGVQTVFFPGSNPGTFGAQAVNAFVNDMWQVFQSGFGKLFIGSKDYIQLAPIGAFPTQFRLGGFAAAADISTTGADMQTQIGYSSFAGAEFKIAELAIPSNQNFNFSMHWPALVPITNAGRIGVYLNGWLTRNSQ